jgi:hypothetical protein
MSQIQQRTEKEEEVQYRTPRKARATGYVTPIRAPSLIRNSLHPAYARNKYTPSPSSLYKDETSV